jgi:serine/threonine-protein kinase
MNRDRWQTIQDIFNRAIELHGQERVTLLDTACSTDPTLRNEVEALLHADGQEQSFRRGILRAAGEYVAASTEEAEATLIGRTVSHYRILEKLGSGGMGLIYKAEDVRLGRAVAVKFLSRQSARNQLALERLRLEARAASALNHPNICTIHDMGECDGEPFIVMEFLDGETLRQRLHRGPLPFHTLLETAAQICDGLQAAHASGIIHRDIKPANIFITRDGRVKILDFGLATLQDDAGVCEVAGTAQYMSPEQVRGGKLDERSDQFALAATLYEMASGAPLFPGGTESKVFDSVLSYNPAGAIKLPPAAAALQPLLRKALQHDPGVRYPGIDGIRVDLLGIRDAGRNRRRLVAAAAIALVLLALLWLGFLRNTRPAADANARWIAVLPFQFENSSEDPHIGLGIAESLIEKLGYLDAVRVRPLNVVLKYLKAASDPAATGRDLHVDSVLDGKLLRTQKGMHVAARLIQPSSASVLWSGEFDGNSASLTDIQTSIAHQMAGALKIRLSSKEQQALSKRETRNPEAYEEYLRGRYLWSKSKEQDYWDSIELFRRAIDQDPKFAQAYLGVADSYVELGWMNVRPPRDLFAQAGGAAARALDLDPAVPDGHAMLARVKAHYDWDFPGAEAEFELAIRLNPRIAQVHHWYSHFLTAMGRTEDSLKESNAALQLDPLGARMPMHMGWHYLYAREYDKSVEWLQKALDRDPSAADTWSYLGFARLEQHNNAEAVKAFRKAVELFKNTPRSEADLGVSYALSGRPADALAIAARLERNSESAYVPPYAVAAIYASLNQPEETFRWLRLAVQDRAHQLIYLNVDPTFDRLRGDPRFSELIGRIGLNGRE